MGLKWNDRFGGKLIVTYEPPTRRKLRRFVVTQIRGFFIKKELGGRIDYGFTLSQWGEIRRVVNQWVDQLDERVDARRTRLEMNLQNFIVEAISDLEFEVTSMIARDLGKQIKREGYTLKRGVRTVKQLKPGGLETKIVQRPGRPSDDDSEGEQFKRAVLKAMAALLRAGEPVTQPRVAERLGIGMGDAEDSNFRNKLKRWGLNWKDLKNQVFKNRTKTH